MGLVNWYREYVPGVACLVEPLHRLTRKNTAWSWSTECELSYQGLKERLTSTIRTLAFPNWGAPFIVETDASNQAVGAVLSQMDEQERRRPIEFYSSGLNHAQKNYSAGELEAWAIVATLRKWRVYLMAANKVQIITDHNPLTWMRRQRDPRNKYARWILELENYNYEITYRRGVENCAADCLSRTPCEPDGLINDEWENLERHVYTLDTSRLGGDIREGQPGDAAIMGAIEQLGRNGQVKTGPFRLQEGMRLSHDGFLYRKKAIIVPRVLQTRVTQLVHKLSHARIERTYEDMKGRFFWIGMKKAVEQCCKSCAICLENKRTVKKREPLHPVRLDVPEPRRVIAADVATLPWFEDGYRYTLVMVDLFSKYSELVAMRDQSAVSICEALQRGWLYRHDIPNVLLTDQRRNVDGRLVHDLCERLGIEKRHTSAYHPQGDGQAERTIESIKQSLRCFLAELSTERSHWPTILQEVAFSHNSLMNKSTRFSPNELMYGLRLRSPLDQAAEEKGPRARTTPYQKGIMCEDADRNIIEAQGRAK